MSFGMTGHRVKHSNQIIEHSYLNSIGKRPQGIEKKQAQLPTRRSTRLRENLAKKLDESYPLLSPESEISRGKPLPTAEAKDRKRKRQQEPQDESDPPPAEKKPRVPPKERPHDLVAARSVSTNKINSVDYWRREGHWPEEYFKMDNITDQLLARKKSSSSLRRKQSDAGSATPSSKTPSDQKSREKKSAPYQHSSYPTLLETKGSFMKEDKAGPKADSKILCRDLLEGQQDVPECSRFSDGVFKSTYQRIEGRNEAKVIQDITRLIVPSAEELADFRAAYLEAKYPDSERPDSEQPESEQPESEQPEVNHLECLVESVNEGWNNSIPVTKTRPQPDYSVGFKRTAFTEDQLNKLRPFIGDFLDGDLSYFMATFYMYFPFLACEVKCGAAALDIADRQNAHSMTIAVRGVVEIFKRVKREKEINREILAFSVSHDHCSVRIYGHYPVIKEDKTTFYRYPIHKFSFTALEGKEKWTAYKFTKNVYNTWVPKHFKRLCSVIDELQSDPDFDVPPLSNGTRLSQAFESHHLSPSNTDSASVPQVGSHANLPASQDITPTTSFSQPVAFKKPRKRTAAERGSFS